MIQQMQVQCDECNGQKEIINPKDRCKACNGDKTVKSKKTLDVNLEKGMAHGSRITFRQESDQAPGIVPGDVLVELDQEDHPFFKREGAQLFFKKKISLMEALTGVQFQIEHLDRRILNVTSDGGQIISPGSVKCIRDEGMPLQKNPTQTGNLYVEFDVAFPAPSAFSPAVRQQLASLLPPAIEDPTVQETKEGAQVDEAFLESCNMEDEQLRWKDEAKRHGEAYDEDGEDEGHHHGPTTCRAQ